MSPPTFFKCLHCNRKHRADPRNRGRQKFCSEPQCRRASSGQPAAVAEPA